MTDRELLDYGEHHISYEIDMCVVSVRLLSAFWPEKNSLTNVLVEGYALHLRNLIEFIYWTPTRDDVNAVHYVRDKSQWVEARGGVSDFLDGVKERADKQIAHLTKKRFIGDAPEKQWDPTAEITALVTGLQLFRNHARSELVHPKVDRVIARLAAFVEIDEERNDG